MPGPRRYQRPTDPITERIVMGFDDFDGWADPAAPAAPLEPFDFRASDEVAKPEAPQLVADPAPTPHEPPRPVDDAEYCPTCRIRLPDPSHLVSWARLTATWP